MTRSYRERYDYLKFIRAYIEAERHRKSHEDLRNYYGGLYEALSGAFGIDFRDRGDIEDEHHRHLMMMFQSCARHFNQVSGLFDGILESSRPLQWLYNRHHGAVGAVTESYREVHFQVMLDIFTTLFGTVDRVVTSEELRKAGFDDANRPDPIDYF